MKFLALLLGLHPNRAVLWRHPFWCKQCGDLARNASNPVCHNDSFCKRELIALILKLVAFF